MKLVIRILESLREHGGQTADQLASRFGASIGSARNICGRLRAEGKIETEPPTFYNDGTGIKTNPGVHTITSRGKVDLRRIASARACNERLRGRRRRAETIQEKHTRLHAIHVEAQRVCGISENMIHERFPPASGMSPAELES